MENSIRSTGDAPHSTPPSRRDVLRGSLALAALQAADPKGQESAGQDPEALRPNVLFLLSDQHRHDAAGYAGAGHASTPNLDALAAAGTRITGAYCQIPLCVPSRQSLLTGQLASTHGNFRNRHSKLADEHTFAHDFRSAGYTTTWIGKTHCNTSGFSTSVGQEDLFQAFAEEHEGARMPEGPVGGKRPRIPTLAPLNPGYLDAGPGPLFRMEERVAERTARELELACAGDQEQPFLLVSSFLNPHPPLFPPADYLELYRDADLPHADGYQDRDALPFRDLQRRRRVSRWKALDPAQVRNITRAYYASIAWMDHCVGQVLACLKRLEAAGKTQRDTLVVYSSDHGEMLGEHGLWQKRALFEGATRVPLILRLPGRLAAGRVLDQVVEHLDLVRTLYELCNVDCGLTTDGRSFAPALLGAQQPWENRARMELTATHGLPDPADLKSLGDKPAAGFWALRQDDWKFIEHSAEERGLYNLREDPDELSNRIEDPAQADRITEMRRTLMARNPANWAFHRGEGTQGERR